MALFFLFYFIFFKKKRIVHIGDTKVGWRSCAVWSNDTQYITGGVGSPVASMLVIFHQPRVGVVTRLWAHGVRQATWRRNCSPPPEWTTKWQSGRWDFHHFSPVRRSGYSVFILGARRRSLVRSLVRRRAPLSIEDANMTAFFPPTWSRDPARYLMEKYWLWCVVETVHNPGKSFREDFRRASELLPSNTAPTLFFVRLSNDRAIWSRAMGFRLRQV